MGFRLALFLRLGFALRRLFAGRFSLGGGLGGLVALATATRTAARGFRRGLVLFRAFRRSRRITEWVLEPRNLFFDQLLDRLEILGIAGRANHQRLARAAGAAGAADAVDIVLGVARHIEVEHMAHRRNIETTGGHIRGDKEAHIAVAEAVQSPHPLALVEIAMDRLGVIAVFLEALGDDIHVNLAVAEDDRVGAGLALAINQRPQKGALLAVGILAARGAEHNDALGDVLARSGRTGDLDAGGRVQESVGDPLDLGRHGGREKEGLAGEGREVEDAFDVGDEAHVEHPVRLVDHHDLHAREKQLAAFEMVKQAAGRGDQNVNAAVDQGVLVLEAHAADEERFGQLGVLGINVEVFGDLRGQFAGGAQDKATRHPGTGAATAEKGDHRQGERGGLAGAGLGDAQDVFAFKGGRDRAGLDRGRGFIAGFGDGFQNLGIKVQIREFGHVRPFIAIRRSGLAGYGTQFPGAPRRSWPSLGRALLSAIGREGQSARVIRFEASGVYIF